MIRHIVLVRFMQDVTEAQIATLFQDLSTLTDSLAGARNFTGGRSESPEQLEHGYRHGFVIDFDTWADLQAYAIHSTHQALGSKIVANADGGLDGIIVLDLPVHD